MDTPSPKAAKALPRTHYSKGDNSGRRPCLRTATTRGGDRDARFFVFFRKLVRTAGCLVSIPPAIYLYFRMLTNDCMTLEMSGPRVCSCPLSFLPPLALVFASLRSNSSFLDLSTIKLVCNHPPPPSDQPPNFSSISVYLYVANLAFSPIHISWCGPLPSIL